MRRWLLRLAGGLILLLLAATGFLAWLLWSSLPDEQGELALAGLQQPVGIARDAHAIPTVRAATVEDAAFALGFLHGQDRLWQMEFTRRLGQGRLAEILGEAALPYDRLLRTLGLAQIAEANLAGLAAETRAGLAAYALGVNAAITRFGRTLPPEFLILGVRPEPWRPADSLLIQKLMALDLSGNWRQELLRARLAQRLAPAQMEELFPGDPPGSPVTLAALAGLPLDELAAALPSASPLGLGSNVWVAAGSRTASGLPLLANDPHLRLLMPGHWYLAAIQAPGLEVIGATLPGLPFVVLGRNRQIAWGFTNTGSDTQDLFIERLDPADPGRYLTPDGAAPFTRRIELIAIRGGAPVRLEVRGTRHGPVISDLVPSAAALAGRNQVLALAWTQLGAQDSTAEAGFALGRAQDWQAFAAAARLYQGAQQNMAYADRAGRIGLISPGLVPIRRSGDGTLPAQGWTGRQDWLGTIPAEALPRTLDPATGLLVNANNRLVGADYPYLLAAQWQPAWRARRILDLLEASGPLDPDRFVAIQLDLVSPLARTFLPDLLAASTRDPDARAVQDLLRGWDGRMAADRPEPLLFMAWYRALAETVYADELGPLFEEFRGLRPDFLRAALDGRGGWCDDVTTPRHESCAERAGLALEHALPPLVARYGPDWRRWRWGGAHAALLAHQPFERSELLRRLFSLVLPIGGDATTVAVAADAPDVRPDLPFGTVHGPGYRAIYDLAGAEGSRWIAATGQSGHPFSRHYRDLARLWHQGRYLAMHPTDARAAGRRRQLLQPSPAP